MLVPNTASTQASKARFSFLTAPGFLDTRLLLGGRLHDGLVPRFSVSLGLRKPFFSISHSAL